MSIEWISITLFGSMVLLMMLGLPVAFSTGAVGVIFTALLQGPEAVNIIPPRVFGLMTNYLLGAIPLFIVMATPSPVRDSSKRSTRWSITGSVGSKGGWRRPR